MRGGGGGDRPLPRSTSGQACPGEAERQAHGAFRRLAAPGKPEKERAGGALRADPVLLTPACPQQSHSLCTPQRSGRCSVIASDSRLPHPGVSYSHQLPHIPGGSDRHRLPPSPRGRAQCCSHFTDKEPEAQRRAQQLSGGSGQRSRPAPAACSPPGGPASVNRAPGDPASGHAVRRGPGADQTVPQGLWEREPCILPVAWWRAAVCAAERGTESPSFLFVPLLSHGAQQALSPTAFRACSRGRWPPLPMLCSLLSGAGRGDGDTGSTGTPSHGCTRGLEPRRDREGVLTGSPAARSGKLPRYHILIPSRQEAPRGPASAAV